MRGLLPFQAPVFALCAVYALAGCTTVSPPPTGGGEAQRPVSGRPERPDDVRVVPAPSHRVLATTRPDTPPSDTPSPGAPGAAGPARAAPPPRTAARPVVPRPRGPARPAPPTAPDVCGLGEEYGGWAPDGQASSICHQVYRR
ncbi:hypothetical protein [Actinacidiphila reveromycinica]|uniref:hypothetical protein n=1 Tax=Actinacidiphila reveromycinica TaxID=659352 RepID=UPI001921E49C|nr:hypothetical protein [Streptomyces sp. SN-593]